MQQWVCYKTYDDISGSLKEELPENVLNVLLNHVNFSDFNRLSLKTLHRILPSMEQGLRYDETGKEIYGDHYLMLLVQTLQANFLVRCCRFRLNIFR